VRRHCGTNYQDACSRESSIGCAYHREGSGTSRAKNVPTMLYVQKMDAKFQHEDICYLLSCCAAQIELMMPESVNIEDNEDAYRARMEHIVAEIVEDVNDCGYESTILSVGRCYVLSVAYFGFSSLLYLPFVW
jgi:hypothetical protein